MKIDILQTEKVRQSVRQHGSSFNLYNFEEPFPISTMSGTFPYGLWVSILLLFVRKSSVNQSKVLYFKKEKKRGG